MVLHKLGADQLQSAHHNRMAGARLTRPVVPEISLADEFAAMLDRWHSLSNDVYDDELDAQIHEWYAEALRAKKDWSFTKVPYFTPSAAESCPRALYMRLKKAKKDEQPRHPHQGRWTRMGTALGDVTQRDLLFIEKHWPRIFGEPAPFTVEKTPDGRPMFENFAFRLTPIEHRGHTIWIYGTTDGILRHTATGKIVGVEIKSKQTTPARTSPTSMRESESKHRQQCVSYSFMYGVDEWMLNYTNLAKKAWEMTPEEYEKSPDLRVFDYRVTDEDRERLLDFFADILDAVAANTPPLPDLTKWTFNNYKTAIALSLSLTEMDALQAQVERVKSSSLKPYQKEQYAQALREIEAIREREMTKGADAA